MCLSTGGSWPGWDTALPVTGGHTAQPPGLSCEDAAQIPLSLPPALGPRDDQVCDHPGSSLPAPPCAVRAPVPSSWLPSFPFCVLSPCHSPLLSPLLLEAAEGAQSKTKVLDQMPESHP